MSIRCSLIMALLALPLYMIYYNDRWPTQFGELRMREAVSPLKRLNGADVNFTSDIAPALIISLNYVASTMRYTRSAMLEVLDQDYIRTARAKGLMESVIVNRHALKNALMPVITIVGSYMPGLLGGAVQHRRRGEVALLAEGPALHREGGAGLVGARGQLVEGRARRWGGPILNAW